MAKKNRGLGRGLDALLPEAEENLGAGQEIAIGDIDPNPDQPRRVFQDESIGQLAQSIRDQGVLQPLLVVPTNGGRYRIVAGERRWRAARQAGLTTIPCIVRDLDVIQQMEIALIENLQREDLNPIDTAQGIRALMQQCGYTQEAVANRLSKSRPAVANLLRLLTLPEEVLEQVAAVMKQTDDEPVKPQTKLRTLPAELSEFETRVRETLGVRATLTGTAKKGKIVLQYYSQDELEHLNELLMQLSDL